MADPSGAVLGNAIGYVDIDSSGVSAGLNQAKQEFNNFISSTGAMLQDWGRGLSNWGSQLTMFTAPLTVAGGVGLKIASDFDSVLTEIQARTGLTAEAMEQIKQAALQAGADTAFSSQQAAEAYLNLLTAGLSVEDSLATLPGVLDAAAAGGMDLARAADYTTSIMSSFGLTATDATRIVDAMAKASGATPATMDEMGEALLRSSASASQFGFSIEETSAMLAIFAKNGLRGSDAGTQLNSMLRNMNSQAAPTKAVWAELGISMYDAAGNARDLDAVFADLRVALDGMTDEDRTRIMMQLAGAEGMLGFQALLAGQSIASMNEEMSAQASANEVATQMMNSFAGQIDSLKGSIETLWITVLTPFMNNVLRPLIGMAIEVVNSIQKWAAANEPLVQTIVSVTTAFLALGPMAWALGEAIKFVGFSLSTLGTIFGFLMSPVGLFVGAIGLLAFIFRDQLLGLFTKVATEFEFFGRMFAESGLIGGIQLLFTTFEDGSSYIGRILVNIFGMSEESANSLANTINQVVASVVSGISALISPFLSMFAAISAGVPILDAFQNLLYTIGGADIAGAFNSIRNAIQNFARAARSAIDSFIIFQQMFAFTGDFVGSAVMAINDFILNFAITMGMPVEKAIALVRGIRDAFNAIGNIFGAFFSRVRAAFTLFFMLLDNGVPAVDAFLTSIASAFAGFNWMQLGTDILNGITSGLSVVGSWVNDTLIRPLMGAFSAIDWGAIGNAILQGIGSAISLYSGWINFVTDNILRPLFTNAQNALGTIDWRQLGEDIIGFIFNPSVGGTGGVDWRTVFNGWMDALVNFGTSAFNFLGWVSQHVILPLWQGYMGGLSQVDWGGISTTLMNLFGTALNALWAGATWVWDNLISPIVDAVGDALNQVDWASIGTTLMNLFGAALNGLWTAGTWVWDNFLSPMITAVGETLADVDWMQLGLDILDAFGSALNTLGEWATWAYDNLLVPLFNSAKTGIESIDWFEVGQTIVDAIGFALQTTFDFMAWVINSIFNPITTNAESAAGGINWNSVGDAIMGAISGAITGFLDFSQWFIETVLQPLIAGAVTAILETDWGSIGQGLMDAIANAIPNMAEWVQTNIIGPIAGALSGFNPMLGVNTVTQMGGGGQASASGTSTGTSSGIYQQPYDESNPPSGKKGEFKIAGSLATGTNYIPKTGLYELHQGEAVIPAAMNKGGGDVFYIDFEQGSVVVQGARNYQDGVEVGRGIGDGILGRLRERGGGR